MYNVYVYHGFGEPYYLAFTGIPDRSRAIQQARDYKRTEGDSVKYFEVYEGERPVYHSIFGALDDPRLP